MCLIVFAWDVHPKYRLIVAANRDEFYTRPTAPADFWDDEPDILGGRDLQAGGSWMTVSKHGNFAAVTNYRDLANIRENVRSRGEIPIHFMDQNQKPLSYVKGLHEYSTEYNGFNVLTANPQMMTHYSNYERKANVITPGIHGLSNALLDTPWPKVELAKAKFQELISNSFNHGELIEMMSDTSTAEDSILPDTGVSREMEKALSAMCIRMENYGTCCSTVITLDRDGLIEFSEKSYPVGGRTEKVVNYQFKIQEN
ncbi:MAG: NRDE family protein [Marinoscillum sp.]|uniref:NRDE family protein n=1 Tax=Marinoscillum sp. TaxID=2024838 RepID=UPI0032FBBBD0